MIERTEAEIYAPFKTFDAYLKYLIIESLFMPLIKEAEAKAAEKYIPYGCNISLDNLSASH